MVFVAAFGYWQKTEGDVMEKDDKIINVETSEHLTKFEKSRRLCSERK